MSTKKKRKKKYRSNSNLPCSLQGLLALKVSPLTLQLRLLCENGLHRFIFYSRYWIILSILTNFQFTTIDLFSCNVLYVWRGWAPLLPIDFSWNYGCSAAGINGPRIFFNKRTWWRFALLNNCNLPNDLHSFSTGSQKNLIWMENKIKNRWSAKFEQINATFLEFFSL